MKSKLFIPIVALVFFACGGSSEVEEGSSVDSFVVEQEVEELPEPEEVTNNQVELDNGQQWEANPETTEGITNMIDISSGFVSSSDTLDYYALEEELHAEYKLIFKRCTMKGEAHNQLHNYLMPLKKKIVSIKASDITSSQSALEDLQVYLADYSTYFK